MGALRGSLSLPGMASAPLVSQGLLALLLKAMLLPGALLRPPLGPQVASLAPELPRRCRRLLPVPPAPVLASAPRSVLAAKS